MFLVAGLDPAEDRVMEVLDPARVSWSHGPDCPLYDKEELYVGTAAEAIRLGADLPLAAYRFMPYGSAGVAAILLVKPLYALFGPHYLVLKIIPLLVTMLGGLAWLLVVRAWLGERAARLFGLLYILAPPILVRTALIEMGGHPEAMAWLGGVCLLATRARELIEGPDRAVALRFAAAAGAMAGLGVWVTYSVVPIAGALAAGAFAITRGRPRAAWLAAGLGLVVGLLPWLSVLAATHGAALQVYGRPLGAIAGGSVILERAGALLRSGFMASYDLPGGIPVRLLAGWLWLLAVAAGWFRLARSPQRTAAILLGAGSLGHLLTFLLVAPDSSSRYLVPVYPFLLIAAIVPAIPRDDAPSGRGFRAYRAGVACVLALGLASQLAVIAGSSFTALRVPLKGTCWPLLGEVAGRKLTEEGILHTPPLMRPFLWVGCGERTFHTIPSSEWDEAARAAGPDSGRVWEGIGIAWFGSSSTYQAGSWLARLEEKNRFFLRRGLAYSSEGVFASLAAGRTAEIAPLLATFDAADRPALLQQLARVHGTLATHAPRAATGTSSALQPADVAFGIGWSLFRDAGPGGELRLWKPAPLEPGPDFWTGVAAAYEWDLRQRDNGWLLGRGEDGPRRLARELAGLTGRLDAREAALFYEAGGRAAANALGEPSGEPKGTVSVWKWEDAIPPAYRADFARGLRTGVTGF